MDRMDVTPAVCRGRRSWNNNFITLLTVVRTLTEENANYDDAASEETCYYLGNYVVVISTWEMSFSS